tara:strand:- start:473 stop:1006 length:534 start_codon:yes stop_codon:yes gene_type:complete
MILSCNSCGKKFVVPDNAITTSGRIVQCGSCGNKWKQFPLNEVKKSQSISSSQKVVSKPQPISEKVQKPKKIKKTPVKKNREISLYSPEYLEKKHGIKINDQKSQKEVGKISNAKVSFGFYSSLLVFIVIIISFSRILYFFQEFIILQIPITKFYLDYFFENIRNLFEIFKNLVSNY